MLSQELSEKYPELCNAVFKVANTRFENGLANHFEYISEKNNLLKVQNETTALKCDLYFKKLIIYYIKGEFE